MGQEDPRGPEAAEVEQERHLELLRQLPSEPIRHPRHPQAHSGVLEDSLRLPAIRSVEHLNHCLQPLRHRHLQEAAPIPLGRQPPVGLALRILEV
jgi:hypothetical protein